MFQSTRPRGARHPNWSPEKYIIGVSIHAPAWGATKELAKINPKLYVSIHAPAWGATRTASICTHRMTGFNPRARVGRDRSIPLGSLSSVKFQSTRPRGARPNPVLQGLAVSFVSIHAPAWGATEPSRYVELSLRVSIHAPAWGATHDRYMQGIEQEFQSTRPRGARL